MRYTLAQNAISSHSIAIENFEKFYYHEEEYKISETASVSGGEEKGTGVKKSWQR